MTDFRLLTHPSCLTIGQPVWSRGRARLGVVGAVQGASFRVDAPDGEHHWLPVHLVALAAPHGGVHLTIERGQVAQWSGSATADPVVPPAMAVSAQYRSA
jgi:hypothetical protein